MADTVTNKTVWETNRYIKIHLTNSSDGTGESNVAKMDKSALLASDAAEPASLDLVEVRWAIQGFSSVKLSWDHTTDDVAMLLSGNGYEDFGDLQRYGRNSVSARADPRSAGGTGDVLLTTAGAVSGASYDISIIARKAEA